MLRPMLIVSTLVSAALPLRADEVENAIQALLRTGPQAVGSAEARVAAGQLSRQGPEILPRLLAAMGTPNIVGANWCRTVYERIVARELARTTPAFPRAGLEQFVRDAEQSGRARRLALALLQRITPGFASQVMPQWLDDPEFRSDAVAFVVQEGERAKANGGLDSASLDIAKEKFQTAFRHARDSDQVLQIMSRLKSVGVAVDPVDHLGFLSRWYLLGPFEAPGMSGFSHEFPPEKAVELTTAYDAGGGKTLRWTASATNDSLGQLNLIQALGPVKEAVGYAYAEVESPRAQAVQLRCSADDNLSVWLNGEKVLAREQWLNGTRLDRFIVPVTLLAGRNRVLVKICQGPQHVDPEVPNNWSFQVRFCDNTGGAVGLRTISPAIPGDKP